MDANRPGRNVEAAGPGTIAAVFKDHSIAERAVSDLTKSGFDRSDIGVAVCQPKDSKMDEGWISRIRTKFSSGERDEYSSEDAGETLRHMGVAPDATGHLERALHEGDVLITVKAGSRMQEASNILQRNGGNLGTAETASVARNIAGRDNHEMPAQRMQLFGEMLRVHKERVQRGEVRLHKEVVSEQKNIDVPVMHEEVVIERVASGRNQPANTAEIGKNQEIRVPVSEERVRVEKTPVVNEEVRVGKRQVQDVQKVSDTVRHEEVKVENDGDVDINKPGRRPEEIRRDQKDKKIA